MDKLVHKDLDADIAALNTFIEHTLEKNDISFSDLLKHIRNSRAKTKKQLIPLSIFTNRKLGLLETLTKYLKENLHHTYHEIALMLNRDDRVIWTTYNKAIKKDATPLLVKNPSIAIPLSVFENKQRGALENISIHLHDEGHQSFAQIARLLRRDSRSIWACYNRGKKK